MSQVAVGCPTQVPSTSSATLSASIGSGGAQKAAPQSALNTDTIVVIGAGTLLGAGLIGYGLHCATRSKKLPASDPPPTVRSASEAPHDNPISREAKAFNNAVTFEDRDRLFQRLQPEEQEQFVAALIEHISTVHQLKLANNIIVTFLNGKMTASIQKVFGRIAQENFSLDPSELDINKAIDEFKILSESDKHERVKRICADLQDDLYVMSTETPRHERQFYFDLAKTRYERFFENHVSKETHQANLREFAKIDLHSP